MKRLVGIWFFVALFSLLAKGQVYFNKEFKNDSSIWNLGNNVYELKNSAGYFVIGAIPTNNSSYIRFLRLNSVGDTVWTKNYGKTNIIRYVSLGKIKSLGDTSFVFMAGMRIDSINQSQDSSLILFYHIDSLGNVLIENPFGDSSNQNIANDIQITSDKGYIITGWTTGWGCSNNYCSFLLKLDSLGNEEWHQIYGGDRAAYSVDTTNDGGYIMSGEIFSFSTNTDLNVVKTDGLGSLQWSHTYGTPNEDKGCFITSYNTTGDYIIAGSIDIEIGVPDDYQAYVARINGTNGNIIWADTLGYIKTNYHNFIESNPITLLNGNIALIGTIHPDTNSNILAWLIILDGNGNLLWDRIFSNHGADSHNYFWDIHQTTDNGFVACGDLINFSQNEQNLWVLKLDSMGCEIPNCSVGLNEIETNKMNVLIYPNPNNGSFTLKIETPFTQVALSIYNITGKQILQQNIIQTATPITLSTYPKGLYFYKIMIDNELITGKIIVD